MATTTANELELPQVEEGDLLQVTSYDRVASLIIAINVFMGFSVALMLVMWLSSVIRFEHEGVKVLILEPRGRGDHAKGYERDVEEPGVEEVMEFIEPQIEETFEAVTDAVTSTAASLVALNTGATATAHGSGMGDSREAGPGGDGDLDVIPRVERWRIKLTESSVDGFARLLDTMQIEIGALGGGIKSVDYANNLSGAIKKRSVEGGKHEKRLFFAPLDKKSELWTRQLLGKGGIQTQGRVILHFYSTKAEDLLAEVENRALQKAGKRLDEVRRTYFSVRRSGRSFQFVVDKQEYRPRPQY
jgi:hypothetical protein